MDIVDLVLVLAEDDDWRWRLLETFEEIHHLGFLLHIFHDLEHVQVGSAGTADVDKNGFHQRLLSEVLDLPWHCRGE